MKRETVKILGDENKEGILLPGEKEVPVKKFNNETERNDSMFYTKPKETDAGAKSEYEMELYEHIAKVRLNIYEVMNKLKFRAQVHDASKFTEAEFDIFEKVYPKLRATTYGTDAYNELLKELGPALDHHYKMNDHHPEHFENGINDMDLFQFIEMLCDWKAAVEKHDDGDIYRSLKVNKERFGIDDQLYNIMKNTIDRWKDK